MKYISFIALFLLSYNVQAQQEEEGKKYKKRVLESTEIDFLSSYYSQDGSNAAVTGGTGTEELTDVTGAFVVSIPLNDDDVLTIDGGISAYTSASSSNIDPFDSGVEKADAFVASSGESKSDVWSNLTASYSHSSEDRNQIVSAKFSVSNEYDYTSIGFGGSYTRLFNKKNTELSVHASAYLDKWTRLVPAELSSGGDDDDDFNINDHTITGNPDYNPVYTPLADGGRNSYSWGLNFAQIMTKKMQGSLAADFVLQDGLLSTPYQRVYFADVENSYISGFHLADDIERLPDTRFKMAFGGRLNYYVNERVVLRSFYRYYTDDWGINSHTISLEVPIKLSTKFTIYPSYRFYNQTAADYFAAYDEHQSTSEFYTSDYDLSEYNANQYGIGLSYTDIFTKFNVGKFGLKSIDLNFSAYERDSGLQSSIISLGVKLVSKKKKKDK